MGEEGRRRGRKAPGFPGAGEGKRREELKGSATVHHYQRQPAEQAANIPSAPARQFLRGKKCKISKREEPI